MKWIKRFFCKPTLQQLREEYNMALADQINDVVAVLNSLADKLGAIQKPVDPDLTPIADAAKKVADAVFALEQRLNLPV